MPTDLGHRCRPTGVEIADSGDEVAELRHPGAMPEEEAENGRGLALIVMISDHLSYRREGSRNLWRVEKRRS